MAPRKKPSKKDAGAPVNVNTPAAQLGGVGGSAPWEAKHPDYQVALPDWIAMRDAVLGQTQVKTKGEEYLPMPSGFLAMKDKGVQAYNSYLTRAQFPEYTEPTIRGMLGVICRVPPKIELPASLEYLREASTADRLPLDALHRYLVREVLTTGRIGVLADAAATGGDPYLTTYVAETVINWSGMGDLFVLDETGNVRRDYWWIKQKQWRILELADGGYQQRIFGDLSSYEGDLAQPNQVGGGRLNEVPFVCIGPLNLTPDLDEIPLLEVARAAFAEYRLDADYRHVMFMSGQETFVITGNIEESRIPTVLGSGVIVTLPENATAQYVSPGGVAANTLRVAIQDERQKAAQAGAKLFESGSHDAESGEALKIRWAAQTATLLSVSMTVAAGLEKALRYCGMFKGMTAEQAKAITVTPNTTFIDADMSPSEAQAMIQLWQSGTLSKRTVYEKLAKGGLTNPDRDFDAEQDEIDVDDIETPPGSNPDDDLPEDE